LQPFLSLAKKSELLLNNKSTPLYRKCDFSHARTLYLARLKPHFQVTFVIQSLEDRNEF